MLGPFLGPPPWVTPPAQPCRPVPRVHAFGKGEQALRRDPRSPPAMRGWLHKQVRWGARGGLGRGFRGCMGFEVRDSGGFVGLGGPGARSVYRVEGLKCQGAMGKSEGVGGFTGW